MIIPTILAFLLSCEKHLIADDPYPYAQEPTSLLIEVYKRIHDEKTREDIRKELEFRISPKELKELDNE